MGAEFSEISNILRRIAEDPSRTPEETKALRVSAFALLFAMSKHRTEFDAFIDEMDAPLTPEERTRLKDMGLE